MIYIYIYIYIGSVLVAQMSIKIHNRTFSNWKITCDHSAAWFSIARDSCRSCTMQYRNFQPHMHANLNMHVARKSCFAYIRFFYITHMCIQTYIKTYIHKNIRNIRNGAFRMHGSFLVLHRYVCMCMCVHVCIYTYIYIYIYIIYTYVFIVCMDRFS